MTVQTSRNNHTTKKFARLSPKQVEANRKKMARLQAKVKAGLVAALVLDTNGRFVGEIKRGVNDG